MKNPISRSRVSKSQSIVRKSHHEIADEVFLTSRNNFDEKLEFLKDDIAKEYIS